MKENSDKVRYLVIMILIFVAIAIIEIVFCRQAFALERISYDKTQLNGGTTYYGFSLPTRPTAFDSSGSAVISLGISGYSSNNWHNFYASTQPLYLTNLDSYVVSILEDNNINYQNVFTSPIKLGSFVSTTNLSYDYYYSIGFRPGAIANDSLDLFNNGFAIDYNANYTYDFDMILYNPNGDLVNSLPTLINVCKKSILDPYNMVCVNNGTITYEQLYSESNLLYFRYHVVLTNNSWLFGFNQSMISDDNSEFGVDGEYIIAFSNKYNIYTDDTILISQPFNITYWSSSIQSVSCTDSCWTQENTDDNQRIENPNDYIFDNLINALDNFDYYGFSGIIHYTYDFIKDLLLDANESCISFSVPFNIRGTTKTITLPSSCVFWSRQDITSYKVFYEMFITGLFSFFIGWKIYNDLIKLYSPDSKIDDEVIKL